MEYSQWVYLIGRWLVSGIELHGKRCYAGGKEAERSGAAEQPSGLQGWEPQQQQAEG